MIKLLQINTVEKFTSYKTVFKALKNAVSEVLRTTWCRGWSGGWGSCIVGNGDNEY